MSKLNLYDTIFILQNHRLPDDTCINTDHINVINSTKKKYRVENSEQPENR